MISRMGLILFLIGCFAALYDAEMGVKILWHVIVFKILIGFGGGIYVLFGDVK